jgi:hypothetical protein
MLLNFRCVLVALAVSGASTSAVAQDWDWKVAPYLWGPSIDGDLAVGPLSLPVDAEFSDLLDVLSGAALVHVEASSEANGFFGDLVWMSLEPDDGIATIGGVAEAQIDATILEAGYVRKLSNIDLELGLRNWDLELEIDPALFAAVKRDDNWTDVFVGIRHERALGESWRMTTEGDIGAGGSDFTYGAQLVFARELRSGNSFVTGLKALGVDYLDESVNGAPFELDALFLGATIGYAFD